MKRKRIRWQALGILLTAMALSLCSPVSVRANRVISFSGLSSHHAWDDGLSEWQKFGLDAFYWIKDDYYTTANMYNESRWGYEDIDLVSNGVHPGDILKFSATIAFFPKKTDRAHIEINFVRFAPNGGLINVGDSGSDHIIPSTKDSGPIYYELCAEVPPDAELALVSFITTVIEVEHLYLKDAKAEILEGDELALFREKQSVQTSDQGENGFSGNSGTNVGSSGNGNTNGTDTTDHSTNTGNSDNTGRVDRGDGTYTEGGYYYFTDRNGVGVRAPVNSFASYVVSYVTGDPWTSHEDCQDPQKTLGLPDDNEASGIEGEYNLGAGGTIVLGFDMGICNGPGDDVYVFEVGGDVEATKVEVSNDLKTWYDVGTAEGKTAGVDISGKVPENQVFQYVRLTDLREYPSSSWPGADIDAVCGLNTRTIPPEQLIRQEKDLSPATGEWESAGSAYLNNQGWYILTEDKTWQNGTVRRNEPLGSENFTVDFDFYTGDHDGADGLWFIFYADREKILKSNDGNIYTGGGYAVELDTHYNSAFGDPASNHVALIQESTSHHLCSGDASGFTEDGVVHHMRVEVQDEICTAFVDGTQVLKQGGIKPTGCYDMCIMGITGGIFNLQAVMNISLAAEFLPVSGSTGQTDPGNNGNLDPGNTGRVERDDGSYTEEGNYHFTDRKGNEVYAPINSFASYVVEYTPGDPWTSYENCQDPQKTLGLPDDNNATGEEGEYNLGASGSIVLGFSMGICDGPGDDIYVFEVGGDVEATKIEVSNDLKNWYDVGVAEGSTAGVDISGKVPEGQVFQYVRLTDVHGSISSWPGADIDAVCGFNIQWIPENQRQNGVAAIGRTAWNGHSYQVFEGNSNVTWAQARDYCISLGGHLATVSSAEENDFLKNLAGNSSKKLFWLGGTDAAREGFWTWITDEVWRYTDWSASEPDNKSGTDGTAQNCLVLNLNRNGWDDLWNEGDSGGDWVLKNIGFICEWE